MDEYLSVIAIYELIINGEMAVRVSAVLSNENDYSTIVAKVVDFVQ